MTGADTLTLTDATFEQEVLRSDVPVLVDFWGENCGPCRQMGPDIDSTATEYTGRAKVGKLLVESNLDITSRYRVRCIPTLLLFKGGQVVEERMGAMGASELRKMIEPHV